VFDGVHLSRERTVFVCYQFFKKLRKRFGRIDALINNAAISEKASTKKTYETPTTATNSFYKQASPYFTLEEYEIADLYLKGAYFCIKEAAKQMVISVYEDEEKQNITTTIGASGAYSIINISSPYKSIPKVEADAYTYSMSGGPFYII
jgi:NAD(P)-dependent dehydrogenase (short-subunit alcohol dehydrogenase family)